MQVDYSREFEVLAVAEFHPCRYVEEDICVCAVGVVESGGVDKSDVLAFVFKPVGSYFVGAFFPLSFLVNACFWCQKIGWDGMGRIQDSKPSPTAISLSPVTWRMRWLFPAPVTPITAITISSSMRVL